MNLSIVASDAALLYTESQQHFASIVGAGTTYDGNWDLNLGAATISFASTSGAEPFTSTVGLLGSAAPGPGSWLWGWANPSGYSDAVLGPVTFLRDRGTQLGLAELTNPEVPLAGMEPRDFVALVAAAATLLIPGAVVYPFAAGGGTIGAVSLHDDRLALPAPSAVTLPRLVESSSRSAVLTPRSFATFANARGIDCDDSKPGVIRLHFPDGTATVSFDEQGRPTNIRLEAPRS